MKNILLLAATIVLSISSIQAQEEESKINRFYVFGGGGPALFSGHSSSFGISAVVNKKWIATIGHLNASRNASAPSDANFTKTRIDFWMFGSATIDYHPEAETRFTYLSFGRYYPATKKISYILDGGIGIANGQDFNYYKRDASINSGEVEMHGVSSNYKVTRADKTAAGFIARAGMDWAFSGGAGMGIDFFYNLCTGGISDNVGFTFRLNIGYMPRYGKNALKQ